MSIENVNEFELQVNPFAVNWIPYVPTSILNTDSFPGFTFINFTGFVVTGSSSLILTLLFELFMIVRRISS
jgi:hypothetical protein